MEHRRLWVGLLLVYGVGAAGCSSHFDSEGVGGTESEGVVRTEQALTYSSQSLSFPFGLPAGSVAVAATNQLRIGDRGRVVGSLSSSGTQSTTIGADAQIGTIWLRPAVLLQERCHVEGDVRCGSYVTRQNGVTVTGRVTQNEAWGPLTSFLWSAPRQTSGTNVNVERGQTRPLDPGAWGYVAAKSGGTLQLRSGTYALRSLGLEPDSRLVLDDAGGPIVLHVAEAYTVRGTISATSGARPEFLVDYLGTQMATLEAPVLGTVLAPNASIKVGTAGKQTHRGAFYGRSVEVEADASVVHQPIPLDLVRGPGPHGLSPIGECVVHHDDGTYTAVFGALNHTTAPVSLPRGPDNRIQPDTLGSSLPDAFLAGPQRRLFTVSFDGSPVSWTLDGQTATLSRLSPACDQVGNFSPVRDTTVKSAEPHRSFGQAATLSVTSGTSGLLDFERASVRRLLGTGQYVERAELRLKVVSGSPAALEVLALRKAWTEAANWVCADDRAPAPDVNDCPVGATWDLVDSSDPVDNPWYRRAPGQAPVQRVEGDTIIVDVTDDVSEWLADPWDRSGWLLRAENAVLELGSRESANPPQLVVVPGVATPAPEPLRFVVDATLQPRPVELDPMDGTPRSVVALADPEGEQSDFVADELMLMTNDDAEAAALASRWGGKVVLTHRFAEDGMPELPNLHLIRIDPSRANTRLAEVFLRSIDNRPGGVHRVSSERALGLLAMAAEQAASGKLVAVNWINDTTSDPYHDRTLEEGPPQIRGVTANPESWPYMAAGTVQDIGVTDAWRVLSAAGLLVPRIQVGFLDRGFWCEGSEWSHGVYTGEHSCEPNMDASGKRWHGSNSISAGFAVPGDLYGAAGPGGPVLSTGYAHTLGSDGLNVVAGLPNVVSRGARIVNMSISTELPAGLAPLAKTFDGLTSAAAGRALLFAGAGNDGENVDRQACIRIAGRRVSCWEARLYLPCENTGVNCVGGLDDKSTDRHPSSNYGAESVDIFGPFDVCTGPTRNEPLDGGFDVTSGTSVSSPFVAGVAALVWAADPDRGRKRVREIIWETANNWSADPTVNIWVNAALAVGRAYGQDPPPHAEITTPEDGDTLSGFLCAQADAWDMAPIGYDRYSDSPLVSAHWTLGRPGDPATIVLTGTEGCIAFPGSGDWVLTFTAVDTAGQSRTDSRTLHFTNEPPEVWLRSPTPDSDGSVMVWADTPTTLRAQVRDPNQVGTFPCASVAWEVDGDPAGSGCDQSITFAGGSEHTLTLRATDAEGAEGTATYTIAVRDPDPGGQFPMVDIISPAEESRHGCLSTIPLAATLVFVPEGRTIASHRWWTAQGDTIDEGPGAGTEFDWTPGWGYCGCGNEYPIWIIYSVVDSAGHATDDVTTITIWSRPC